MNTLYYGDNLNILRRYIRDELVDPVYLDPPFNSNRNDNAFQRPIVGLCPDSPSLSQTYPSTSNTLARLATGNSAESTHHGQALSRSCEDTSGFNRFALPASFRRTSLQVWSKSESSLLRLYSLHNTLASVRSPTLRRRLKLSTCFGSTVLSSVTMSMIANRRASRSSADITAASIPPRRVLNARWPTDGDRAENISTRVAVLPRQAAYIHSLSRGPDENDLSKNPRQCLRRRLPCRRSTLYQYPLTAARRRRHPAAGNAIRSQSSP